MPTQEQANTMWCPFARELHVETAEDQQGHNRVSAASYNRNDQGGLVTMCEAARCMAWRWLDRENLSPPRLAIHHPSKPERSSETEPARPANVPASFGWEPGWMESDEGAWVEPEEDAAPRYEKARRGFCGLAGSPTEGGAR